MADTIINEKEIPGKRSEIGFTIDNISPLFRFLFPAKGELSYQWEKPSVVHSDITCKKFTTDFVLITKNGQEIGCGEIKPSGTSESLVETDRARIAEIMKRQLHVRMMKSKHIKEHITFGIIFDGFNVELYSLTFNTIDCFPYKFNQLEKLKLPSSPELYNNMEETLEYLLSFKELMISSLADDNDISMPLLHHNYTRLFKPTLAFKN